MLSKATLFPGYHFMDYQWGYLKYAIFDSKHKKDNYCIIVSLKVFYMVKGKLEAHTKDDDD